MVQLDVHLRQFLEAAREHAVVEDDEGVVDDGAGVPQRLGEADLGAAIGRQILDEEGAPAFGHVAFNERVLAEALGLLAHIGHGRHQPVRHPRGERDACRLTTGDDLDLLVADMAADLLDTQARRSSPWHGGNR